MLVHDGDHNGILAGLSWELYHWQLLKQVFEQWQLLNPSGSHRQHIIWIFCVFKKCKGPLPLLPPLSSPSAMTKCKQPVVYTIYIYVCEKLVNSLHGMGWYTSDTHIINSAETESTGWLEAVIFTQHIMHSEGLYTWTAEIRTEHVCLTHTQIAFKVLNFQNSNLQTTPCPYVIHFVVYPSHFQSSNLHVLTYNYIQHADHFSSIESVPHYLFNFFRLA